ncbi:IgaA/UmoB family intracellular growth attenuator [Escherichia coli]
MVSDEGSDFVDQPWPSASLYDYPPQEQWNAFQKLAQMLMHTPFNAEGIVTKIFTDANGTQHLAFIRSRIVPACGAISAPHCCSDDAG